jgi:hypothetical protein
LLVLHPARLLDCRRTYHLAGDCAMSSSSFTQRRCLRAASVVWLLALGACGTYAEPKPGVHRNVGEALPETYCEFGAPTAMRISAWTCRKADKMAAEEGVAKETLEKMHVFQPRNP